MASRIQGITVEIGGDTTKLQNALKGVNGQIKSTQSQLKDVNKLPKLNPGNTELLAQKHKLLAEAVSEMKEKLTTLKTAAEQANTALANGEISQEQYDAIQRKIVETEQDLKNLETQANQSATAVQKISENCTWGIRRRFEIGKHKMSTKRFLGYDADENGKLVINRLQEPIVVRLYQEFLDGKTTDYIKRIFGKEGIKNWDGGRYKVAGYNLNEYVGKRKV